MLVDRFELALACGPSRSVQKLAREEARLAGELLAAHPEGSEQAVHEFRKSMKGLRALARLVRRALGSEFDTCNRALRDAGRLLSALRDEEAVLEAVQALRTDFRAPAEQAALDQVERWLTTHRASLRVREELPKRIPLALEALHEAATLLERVHSSSHDAMEEGLRRSYRAARRHYRQLQKHRDDFTLHELRKRIKDHRFHLELLGSSAPSMLASARDIADETSEHLGLDHDLVLLASRLCSLPLEPAIALELERMIAVQRTRHQNQALTLCESLLDARPKDRSASILSHVRAFWSASLASA